MLNLYLIKRKGKTGYDEYSEAVVVAVDATEAATIHPSGDDKQWEEKEWGSWVTDPSEVDVERIGTVYGMLRPRTVICASFHAG